MASKSDMLKDVNRMNTNFKEMIIENYQFKDKDFNQQASSKEDKGRQGSTNNTSA